MTNNDNTTNFSIDSPYKSVFDALPIGITILNENKFISYSNKAFEKLTGYSYKEMNHADIWWEKCFPEKDYREKIKTSWRTKVEKTITEGFAFEPIIALITCKNGDRKFCEARFQEFNNNQLILVSDITDRISAQELLEKTEETYQAIYNGIDEAIFIHDYDTFKLLDVNPAALRMFGCSYDEMLVSTPNEMSFGKSPYSTTEAFHYMQKAKKEGIQHFEWKSRKKTGSLFWTEITVQISKISGKNCIMAVIRDINDRKESELKLKESQSQTRSIIDAIPDILFRIKNDGTFIDYHAPDISKLALLPDSIQHSNISEMPLPNDLKKLTIDKINDCLKTGEMQIYEYKLNLETEHFFEARIVPCCDTDVIALIRDITELKQTEAKLVEAQRMDSIGNLAGGIAHDFNNMLAGIAGYASLLKQLETDERKKKYINGILHAVSRSKDLTQNLLAFARRGKNLVKPVNLNHIISEVHELLHRSIDKKISIIKSIDRHLHTIDADPSQMNQLLMNLCINAAEAMTSGGEIILATENRDIFEQQGDKPAGSYVVLEVEDTGCGMDKETVSRIFEPFFTTKTNEVKKGTGLGLSTVYGIVKNHDGFIYVDSDLGSGTTFRIFFPKGKKEIVESPPIHQKISATTPKTILVIEDESMLREMMQDILESMGHKVILASNGEEGAYLFSKQHLDIDLVILDMKMPVMDGKETIIKLMSINSTIPVLLSTGFGQNEEAQEILDLGAKDLLSKPYNVDEITQKIASILP